MILVFSPSLRKKFPFYFLLLVVTSVLALETNQALVAQTADNPTQIRDISGLKNVFFLGVSLWEWIRVSFNATVIGLLSVFLREFLKNQDNKRKKKQEEITKEVRIHEKEISEERLRYENLKNYLDQMTEVLLSKNTLNYETEYLLQAIVRARTIVVLQEIDWRKRGLVIRFLEDCNIIKFLDLSKANLQQANLRAVNLSHAYLRKADFSGANFQDADLSNSNLEFADLTRANFLGANLEGANLTNVIGITLEQIKVAQNWEKAQYDEGFLQQNA